ncbi:arylsulfatase [Flexithrix dorotheae]|uniref:arylsulfatase n=1 Tax=Flexithrix dorotheae TaxID=70993 RepID=UPI0003794903|nr:arylsulfatase [Flexithrix dorotheae]
MKYHITHILLCTFFLVSCSIEEEQTSENQAPNIILILVDDMGYSDIGCFGGEISTPNIDLLAEKGTRFTQFYNNARCCPSRASLMTGLYPHQAGMGHQNVDHGHHSYSGRITNNATTIAEVLSENGYRTYHVGKWHLGNESEYWPDKKGFQQSFTLVEGAMNYYNRSPWLKNQDSLMITYNSESYLPKEGFYATTTFTDTAMAFVERHDFNSPLFMYLAYNAPHWPLHAPQEDIDPYKGQYLLGWDSLRTKRFERMKELGILLEKHTLSERFHSVPAWSSLSDSVQQDWDSKMALYAGVMANLDRNIGRLLSTLEEKNQLDNTLIVFMSDNGACYEDPVPLNAPWSNHPTDGVPGGPNSFPSYGTAWANAGNTPFAYFKSYLHEGGIISPLIVSYPNKVPAGKIDSKTVGHITDILPTFLDLTEAEYPSKIENRKITPFVGTSLLSAFYGEKSIKRDTMYWEHEFHRAIRVGDWKLISPYKIRGKNGIYNQWELYDLKEDPTEQQNLAAQYPDKVEVLSKAYEVWAKKVNALTKVEMDSVKRLKMN